MFVKKGFTLQSNDWVAIKGDMVFFIEVKEKNKRFKNIDIEGHGLNKSQAYLRTLLLDKTGIRTLLIIIEKWSKNIYYNYIDELEKGYYFDTKNGIRIYPLYNYKQM